MGFVRIFWKNNVQEVTTPGLYLKDNLPSNANFWQVGLLDVVLSEYPDKSRNFMRLCPKQGQEPITSWQGI